MNSFCYTGLIELFHCFCLCAVVWGCPELGPPLLIAGNFFLSFYLGFIFGSWSTVAIEELFPEMVFRLADPDGGAGDHAVFRGGIAPIFPEAVRCLRMTGCFKHVLADCPLDAVAPPPPPPPPPLERAATKCVYSAPSLRRNSCRLRFRVLRFASLLVFLGRGLCPGFWLWARFVSGVLALGAVCVLACLWARFVSWLAFGRGLRPGRL